MYVKGFMTGSAFFAGSYLDVTVWYILCIILLYDFVVMNVVGQVFMGFLLLPRPPQKALKATTCGDSLVLVYIFLLSKLQLRTVWAMHPQGYPTEAVPLQAGSFGGLPGQPGVVQHTAVNITAGQRVITEPPKDYIIWSLCCFFYSNPFCLGLAALINSIKVSLLWHILLC